MPTESEISAMLHEASRRLIKAGVFNLRLTREPSGAIWALVVQQRHAEDAVKLCRESGLPVCLGKEERHTATLSPQL
jgi:hypothetical protein